MQLKLLSSISVIVFFAFLESIQCLSWTYRFRSYEPKACFYINVAEVTQTIPIYFNLHESKSANAGHDIDYAVTGPNGQQLMTEQKVNYKDFKIQPIMPGEHSICFMHHGSPSEKVIDIDVSLIKTEAQKAAAGQSELTPSPTADIERVNSRVSEDLNNLHHSLLNVKDKEKANHSTVKSILRMIKYFSIFQCLTVVALGFAHVYVLKTFFSNNAKTRV